MNFDFRAMRRLTLALLTLVSGCGLAHASNIQTWWHDNAELNASTAVAPDKVRRSTFYDVSVAPASNAQELHPSFTYLSLPRSGREKWEYSSDDGAEFSAQAHSSLSWSSFLYDGDAWVYVELKKGPALTSADQVTIRPTTLAFQKELVAPRTVRIRVPYSAYGYRFSVEFDSERMTSYKHGGSLTTDGSGNPAVHVEPRNGLMVFAEPLLTGADVDRLVPNPAQHSIYYPERGFVGGFDQVNADVVYFRPGTYYMDWNHHAFLSPNVRWIYLAPGAYVKGAFQFQGSPGEVKVTGFGVLSGEQYVYEADRDNGYHHRAHDKPDCHGTCVKMLEFAGAAGPQHLTLHGVTIANPPYHAFVVNGDTSQFTMDASHTKHLGAWYWQSDGLELYGHSTLSHAFDQSNDDVLKLYSSHVQVEDVTVWKLENGPVIQWGWTPRNLEDVHVSGVDVIHNRMYLGSHNSCILNSARDYRAPDSMQTADPATHESGLVLENIRSEGMNLCAMRLYALSSWNAIHIRNLWIERWSELDSGTQASRLQALTNGQGQRVEIGNENRDHDGLSIEGYVVGDEPISREAGNWQARQPGRLDFDPALWDEWGAT